MYYVYILRDSNSKLYVGYSADLKQRMKNHITGHVSTTQGYDELRLIWYSAFIDKDAALKFERYLKEGSGHAFARKHLVLP